jgi:hypothetical protein
MSRVVLKETKLLFVLGSFALSISKGRFRGTDFWVEVKKWPSCPYAALLREIHKNGGLW